jgi:hypothetical protein
MTGIDSAETAGRVEGSGTPSGSSEQAGPGATRTDRGQAEQIDFLNGIVILLFGVGLFFAGGSVLLSIGVDSSPDRQGAALNADQRLVEDLLVGDIEDTQLDRDCVDAYFRMNASGVCTRASGVVDGSGDEQRWLRHSLGLETKLGVNVTVVDNGSVVTGNGTAYSLGPSPPPDVAVFESNRFVTFGDGEYHTVFVRVW